MLTFFEFLKISKPNLKWQKCMFLIERVYLRHWNILLFFRVHLESWDFWPHPLKQELIYVCGDVFSKLG